ncbi:glutathione S-transferase kappa 1 [Polychytrium aggregatum]|uniref:glutathione S-transferase kappa 1 n=1 Tax=Polychytrium aggregatum TaxID=110093 RepID=UPI0022FF3292|nr:glutathione S-transferase kappa 1 [Polychytrium aggregatum]KAI9202257.1 glutathione S-transferase kappa 1 [Polychytrium aggregatum]
MPARCKITLLFDVVSPYTLFAFQVLRRYQRIWTQCEFIYEPCFLGGIMKQSGNVPPATNPYKGGYLFKDIARVSQAFDIGFPLGIPDEFPSNSLNIMRLLRVVKELENEAVLLDLSFDYWKAYWGDNQPLSSPETLARVLRARVGASKAEEYIQLSKTAKFKDQLVAVTKAATEQYGAFGMPWIIVEQEGREPESFFGSDRFETMAIRLGLPWHGPLGQGPNTANASGSAFSTKL